MADAQRVVATAGLLSVGVGSVNAIAAKRTLPSSRFLIGSGVAFLLLSALAEAEPEIAKALSIAVLTTVLLGEGDGVLSYINHRGEIDTSKSKGNTGNPSPSPVSTDYAHGAQVRGNIGFVSVPPPIPYPNLPITAQR